MKRNRLGVILVLAVITVSLVLRQVVFAKASLPGTEGDPLVTRSYVEDKLAFKVIEIPEGKKLIASSGTEIILRGGQAAAIDSDKGGLSDVTAGVDIRGGEMVSANHLLIVPRDDGRGLQALTDIIVMVRGSYTLP